MPVTTLILLCWIQLGPCIQLELMPECNRQILKWFADRYLQSGQIGELQRCYCPLGPKIRKIGVQLQKELKLLNGKLDPNGLGKGSPQENPEISQRGDETPTAAATSPPMQLHDAHSGSFFDHLLSSGARLLGRAE